MGVGYVIGPRIAGTMFAGGVLSWLVLLPLLSILGASITDAVSADSSELRQQPGDRPAVPDLGDGPGQIWSAYIRYIGAGAVLAAGSDHAGAARCRRSWRRRARG